jgi:type 1 glutamine amidotransferase
VLRLDESSYQGGNHGEDHPIAWYREYEGGRTFYTGLGHTEAAYDDPDFQKHLMGGIRYCLGLP